MGRRFTLPAPKIGIIDVRWGRPDRYSEHSLCYTYGNRDGKADCRIVSTALEDAQPGRKSLADELEARGYDLTTLRFTIKQKGKTQ